MKPFSELEGLVSCKIEIMRSAWSLIKLETKLMGLSIFPLLINLCLVMVVLMSTWLVSMFLLGHVLLHFIMNPILTIAAVLLLNLIFLVLLVLFLSNIIRRMSFEKTREYLTERRNHEAKFQEEAYSRNRENTEKLTDEARGTSST